MTAISGGLLRASVGRWCRAFAAAALLLAGFGAQAQTVSSTSVHARRSMFGLSALKLRPSKIRYFGLLLLIVAATKLGTAFGAIAAVPTPIYGNPAWAGTFDRDPAVACDNWARAYAGGIYGSSETTPTSDPTVYTCTVYRSNGWYYSRTSVWVLSNPSLCSANSSPSGSACSCNKGFAESAGTCTASCPPSQLGDPSVGSRCSLAANLKAAGKQCPATGNPITIGNGNKWLQETDITSPTMTFSRYYNSQPDALDSMIGRHWSHDYAQWLYVQSQVITAARSDGQVLTFTKSGSAFVSEGDRPERLSSTKDGNGVITAYYLQLPDAVETYGADGRLLRVTTAVGRSTSLTYTSGKLSGITEDVSGRVLNLNYDAQGRIASVVDTLSQLTTYSYDTNGNLATVTYPDGSAKNYVYGEAAYTPGGNLPNALTGVFDENGSRTISYLYDATGRAIGETQTGVGGSVSLDFSAAGRTSVTDAAGISRLFGFQTIANAPKLATLSQPAGSGCGASSSLVTYDAGGNVLSRDDFSGNRVCYAYDGNHREITRVEGLSASASCAAVLTGSLPLGARRITTTWHPDWQFPTQVDTPLQRITNVYHGQADPFNGNAQMSCASTAALSNGKPAALLCKRVTQVLLASGAVDSSVSARLVSYTYDAAGRVLTTTDERGGITATQYWANTSFAGGVGHTIGDIKQITNAAGQTLYYDEFDKAGRVHKMHDIKGVSTEATYSPRGRVQTVTLIPPGGPGRVTAYTYDPAGQLTQAREPDGISTSYVYDAAHRLTVVSDGRGNSVTYMLDSAGNRIGEDVKDPTGTLQRSVGRSFDVLNRLQQVTSASN